MIRTCSACGQKNRIAARHLASQGRCGACQAPLAATATPINVTEAEFGEIIAGATVPVLVDFWAAWCGPCKMAAPHLEAVAKNMAGRGLVLKVNTEQEPALARRYQVASIPHFMVFAGGELVSQQSGLVPAQEMQRWLAAAATNARA